MYSLLARPIWKSKFHEKNDKNMERAFGESNSLCGTTSEKPIQKAVLLTTFALRRKL